MRTAFAIAALGLALLTRGEVLDRLAVSIDNDVITEHQVLQQLRLAAFENREPLVLSGAQKRKAAEQLVERRLIHREMQLNHYGGPEDAAVDAELRKVKGSFPGEAAYRAALTQYGISGQELREFEREQLAVLRFIELRFRPAIQVSKAELEDYYQNEFTADWQKKSKQPPPPLDTVRDKLEEIITSMRETQALDRWLGEVRRQSDIRWQQEVFQ